MGMPIQRGPLTPSDLQYYAPRKLRDGATDLPSIQAADKLDSSGDAQTSDNWKTDDGAPVPNAFQSRQHINDIGREKRSGGLLQAKTLGVAAAAATLGIIAAVGFLGWQNTLPPTQQRPEMPFAARLDTATTDLQKVSQQGTVPTLAAADSSGYADTPLPLGVEVKNYTVHATINLGGLLPGTAISAGAAERDGHWRIAIEDLPKAQVLPPPGYTGLMTIIAELRTPNGQPIVQSPVRLTWRQKPVPVEPQPIVRTPASRTAAASPQNAAVAEVPKQAAAANVTTADEPRQIDPKEVAILLRRAEELLSSGDLAAGRLLLQRVAETKNARAAFQLATTYDPNVIQKYGSKTVAADSGLAQFWYQRAKDWGAADATGPIEALANRTQ